MHIRSRVLCRNYENGTDRTEVRESLPSPCGLGTGYDDAHFTEKETKAQKGPATCPCHTTDRWQSRDQDPRPAGLQRHISCPSKAQSPCPGHILTFTLQVEPQCWLPGPLHWRRKPFLALYEGLMEANSSLGR